ncbi:aspartyl aminopeptidase-like protein [Piptocephalis cylindrospora]|uniref:aspartyl aminopeptidase n=1 Tax=Piptocephalis cylindrospora TaxID=1907219 RepID=A0A4P9Y5V9_9FUNG|nr:aspartyl aminopeptidase-like protein [Piptocephalis cylindrospora]|eukprot:RKP14325.1 aspartyl aminopeptidase-like protein [Piptocephalis cylindrospora]
MSASSASIKPAANFVQFVNQSPTPFHAVAACKERLNSAGFTELHENENWAKTINPKGKYFFTRNQSTLVAFAVGAKWTPGNGISIVAAHTDSPCLKLKPVSKKEKAGYLQVGVQTYGGGIWHSWFDRDLGLAGRAMVANGEGQYAHRLFNIAKPILRIPTLAIHLDRSTNEKFQFNNETHLTPILATEYKSSCGKGDAETKKAADGLLFSVSRQIGAHHPELLQAMAEELSVDVKDIVDFEACLYDSQPSAIGGLKNEFIFSARLDNLMMSYCSVESLIRSTEEDGSLDEEENIRLIALFDNEEVGSTSAYGANSSLMETTMRRIQATGQSPTAFEEGVHRSYMISADMAHAVHPNFSEKHEDNHQPQMHRGIVIKRNVNQRYATTAVTGLVLRELAAKHTIPIQEFVVRNDSPCGSTIGPMLSARLGLRTVDVGAPQLSMHSIREVAGTDDVGHSIDLFTAFFQEFTHYNKGIWVD